MTRRMFSSIFGLLGILGILFLSQGSYAQENSNPESLEKLAGQFTIRISPAKIIIQEGMSGEIILSPDPLFFEGNLNLVLTQVGSPRPSGGIFKPLNITDRMSLASGTLLRIPLWSNWLPHDLKFGASGLLSILAFRSDKEIARVTIPIGILSFNNLDRNPPSLSIVWPPNQWPIFGNEFTIAVSGKDDFIGVSRIDFYFDNQFVWADKETDQSGLYTVNLDLTGLDRSVHFVHAIAYDFLGNSRISEIVIIYLQ